MNVMFTEVGYGSYAGANITPYAGPGSSSVLDINEQNNCYAALLSVCRNYSWWKGAFWWNWDTNPSTGGLNNDDCMPQNKPASTVTLRDYYITLVGDLDDDRTVDIDDLVIFCDYWLDQNLVGWPDFNNDKNVDFRDFALLAANWQQSIPPP